MITAIIDAGQHYCQAVSDLWQWDYGQTLRIQGVKLPAAVEVQFSTTERIGETVTRIGVTQEGVTEATIPDTLLEGGGTTQDYTIYAFVYIENGDSGKTEYRVSMKVRARPKPEAHATPEEGELFRQAIVAVAESADRAESARKSAETAADQAENAKKAAEAAKAAADADKEAAEAAQAKAEAAQKAAENAETEAKKAQTATETAKTAVETMQSTVAGYADNANVAKEAAETARSEAETAKNDAVQAKEAAEKAKIGTAADREVTEAASKAAQVSAVSAEKSAERAETAKEEIQESADQIQKNAIEIDSLKEDLSNKITKFYASNQGETHITDSDNGKIQDMMIYGKSSQDGTPTPENPVEIKNVVNPIVKVCGKNLWNPILGGYISGVDGSITAAPKTSMAVTDFIKTSGKDITVIARNFSSAMKDSFAYRIGFYDVGKKWIKNIALLDGSKYSINTFNITGTEYIRVSAPPGIYDTIQIEKGSEATPYEPYTEQSVQLPYTLNAIPVTSGGNVTIDGQQYIADYVDVERGKVIRNILKWYLADVKSAFNNTVWHISISKLGIDGSKIGLSNMFKIQNGHYSTPTTSGLYISTDGKTASLNMRGMADEEFKKWLSEKNPEVYNVLTVAEEIPITLEEASAFKQLMTYYPVTNISVNSEQLDGLTVFNYPISMENGWNYVKKQLNDNRDYIYNMDIQSTEAYVNSEYAVALTELEV